MCLGPVAHRSYDSALASLEQMDDSVEVVVERGGTRLDAVFDAVILVEGLHSTSRALVLPAQTEIFDTGWAGWVVWMDTDDAYADHGDEISGNGFFVGIYPVKERAGIFVGGIT